MGRTVKRIGSVTVAAASFKETSTTVNSSRQFGNYYDDDRMGSHQPLLRLRHIHFLKGQAHTHHISQGDPSIRASRRRNRYPSSQHQQQHNRLCQVNCYSCYSSSFLYILKSLSSDQVVACVSISEEVLLKSCGKGIYLTMLLIERQHWSCLSISP